MVNLYGIKNCDTVKKARNYLENNGIDYTFHDFREDGLNDVQLRAWVTKLGWEKLLNKRSATWRNLPQETKDNLSEVIALAVMEDQPTIIKRPVMETSTGVFIGFSEKTYDEIFS